MCARLPFDVFRREKIGLSWLGSASTIEEAHFKIVEQSDHLQHEYTIVNTQTGVRTLVDFQNFYPSGPPALHVSD